MTEVVMMMVVIMVMIMVMMMPGVIPVRIVPTPVIAVPVVRTVPVVVVIPVTVVRIIIGVAVRVVTPVPTGAHIDIGGATAGITSGVVVVVIVHGGAGSCAETLDAGREILVVVGFGGGVNHAIGVGHRFSSLIHGLGNGLVIFAVGIIRLIVIGGAAADP